VVCALSNGYVADDPPWVIPNPPNRSIFCIFRRYLYLCNGST